MHTFQTKNPFGTIVELACSPMLVQTLHCLGADESTWHGLPQTFQISRIFTPFLSIDNIFIGSFLQRLC